MSSTAIKAPSENTSALSAVADLPWWKGATIYQVYPRSYLDSNGDGIGDLRGIEQKLDYIASLGVDGVWLSPFFKSPMNDFGYDVQDYCDVDPIFGTLADFDRIIEKAHRLNLKVIIDQVYSHTSDLHAWFEESRQSRDNPKADWYVWADAKPDGSPPNNWQSVFGGPSWKWDARRGQYYFHNFLTSQPDLNLHNREVQDAVLNAARFWLDRGVDGFRLDALNFSMHDPQLRDNPPLPDDGRKRTRPFDFQDKIYSMSHPDIVPFLERLRSVMNEYDGVFTVAEVGGEKALKEMKDFTHGDDRLNSAYSFVYLYAEQITKQLVQEASLAWPDDDVTGWPSWAFSNHDAPRAISRWGNDQHAYARMMTVLLLALRGNAIIYQGEELGLPQAEVPFEMLQDPEAITNWPETLGRDGARTPMPWHDKTPNAGFSDGQPWLPVDKRHLAYSVAKQEEDPNSILSLTRQMIALRNAEASLHHGNMTFLEAPDDLLIFERAAGNEHIICAFNMSAEPISWQPERELEVLLRTDQTDLMSSDWPSDIPPFSAIIARS
jgi:alpha-glucosidase